MRCGPVIFSSLSVLLGVGALAQVPPRESGVRGRVVVEATLLQAKVGPLDRGTSDPLRTPAQVRRPAGRAVGPMLGQMPELKIVLEGENLRPETPPPPTLVLEGYRFSPSQVLMTRPGPVALENRHTQPITIVRDGNASAKVGAGETIQIALQAGEHTLTIKEMPYARGFARVLASGHPLQREDNGDIRFTPLPEGDYSVSFWLGTELLFRPTSFFHDRNSVQFIEATVSANRVVTVAVKDATIQVAIPAIP
jgi:hypothetical protein